MVCQSQPLGFAHEGREGVSQGVEEVGPPQGSYEEGEAGRDGGGGRDHDVHLVDDHLQDVEFEKRKKALERENQQAQKSPPRSGLPEKADPQPYVPEPLEIPLGEDDLLAAPSLQGVDEGFSVSPRLWHIGRVSYRRR